MIRDVERAWRAGEVRHEEKGDRRAMLEAVCRLRAQLGLCVLCYVPAHEGSSPRPSPEKAEEMRTGPEAGR